MSLNNNIQNALATQLAAVPGIPSIAFPNTNYEPAAGTSFVRPSLMPSRSVLYTFTQGKHEGMYQVDIFTSVKKGTAPLLLIADAIRDKFRSQNKLTSGTDLIFIQEVSVSQARRVESWWSCYVEINYFCFN